MAQTGSIPRRTYRGEAAEERRLRRRARLLEAGLELLGKRGWQATTVTAVCELAQLTPRYFYESFVDRDELLVAIFDGIVEEITHEVLAAEPRDAHESLRATVTAFVRMATEDPRKGKAAFVEAFGSEALMRRRFERMHWFAGRLAEQARAGRRLRKAEARRLQVACLVAAGGLIETMVAWLQGDLDSSAAQVIDGYTRVSSAGLSAALAPELGGSDSKLGSRR
jgi:AcrR family transcriptional regulator